MIELTTKTTDADNTVPPSASVTLPIEKRVKSRLRVTLDDGREAGIFLTRGEQLQHGDQLQSTSGEIIEVLAADENVSVVVCDNAQLFARACYHLGNRHVPVEIVSPFNTAVGKVSYLHDHVLDDMLRGLGMTVQANQAPFEPEPGAYGGGHSHNHSHHEHSHSHSHSHEHG